MRKDWTIVFILWGFFLLRGLAHIMLLPPLEGFDSIGHIDYLQYLKDHNNQRAITDMHFSSDVSHLLRLLPSNRNLDVYHIARKAGPDPYRDYFQHSEIQLRRQKDAFRSLPAEIPHRRYLPEHFNWQGKHPPFYYLVINAFTGLFDSTRYYEQFFLARLASLLMLSTSVVMLFFTGRYLDQTVNRGYPLKIILPALFTAQPMIYIVACRISNDALAFPLNTLVLMLLCIWTISASRMRYQTLFAVLIGFSVGLAVIAKTYALIYFVFLPLFGLFLFARFRNYRLLSAMAVMLVVAAGISYPTLSYHLQSVQSLDGSHIGNMQLGKGTLTAFIHMYINSLEGYRQLFRMVVIRLWIGNWSSLGNYLPVYFLYGALYISTAWYLWQNRRIILSSKDQLNLLVLGLLLQFLLIAALMNLGVKLYMRNPEPKNLVGYYSYAFYVTELLIFWVCFGERFKSWVFVALTIFLLADGCGLFAQMAYYLGAADVGALKMVVPDKDFISLLPRNWNLSPWIPLPLSGFLAIVGAYYIGLPIFFWYQVKQPAVDGT